MLGKVWKLLKM